jgi:hypothetical protein
MGALAGRAGWTVWRLTRREVMSSMSCSGSVAISPEGVWSGPRTEQGNSTDGRQLSSALGPRPPRRLPMVATDQLAALDKLLSPQPGSIRQANTHKCCCVEEVRSLLRAFSDELRNVYGLPPPSAPQGHVREDSEDTTLVVDRQPGEEPSKTPMRPLSLLPIVEDDDDDVSHPGITCGSCQQVRPVCTLRRMRPHFFGRLFEGCGTSAICALSSM